jgi:hypothetical protein
MKIVINTDYGGFGLSDQAFKLYLELSNIEYTTQQPEEPSILQGSLHFYDAKGNYLSYYDIPRNDPKLVQVVETLGEQSWGNFANLKVVDIPDGVTWELHEYDGIECVREIHRVWS